MAVPGSAVHELGMMDRALQTLRHVMVANGNQSVSRKCLV